MTAMIKDAPWLNSKSGKKVELVVTGVDSAQLEQLDHSLPTGSVALLGTDQSARRVAEKQAALATVPTKKIRSRLVLTLGDDRLGVLSQR